MPRHSCPVSSISTPAPDCKIWLWCQPRRSSFGCSQISTDDCRQDDQKRLIKKGKTHQILCKRDVFFCFCHSFQYFHFHSHFPIMPWYHAQYVLQRLTHKIYLNIIFSISIAMSSLRTMLLMKLNLTSASIPFSWSVNKLETIWALNFWQIFLLYIS